MIEDWKKMSAETDDAWQHNLKPLSHMHFNVPQVL